MGVLSDLVAAFVPLREAGDAPPVMDGPLRPNRRLDAAAHWSDPLAGCDDLAVDHSSVLVTAGNELLRITATSRQSITSFDVEAGPLCRVGTTLYVGLAGRGVVRVEEGAITASLPMECATAIVALPDGRLAIAEGSSALPPSGWQRDLLNRHAFGRIVIADADLSHSFTAIEGLAWPAGLLVNGDALWYSEAWRHRIQRLDLHDLRPGMSPGTVLRDLPGYPGRMSPGIWLSVFAVRTHLVDFILREHRYRDAMLATVDPRYWIAPTLTTTGHYLEPLQGGAIKKLGTIKPWAPPRSYGLVVKLSSRGEILDSLHSRAGGRNHGITAAAPFGASLLVVSKGGGQLLEVDAS